MIAFAGFGRLRCLFSILSLGRSRWLTLLALLRGLLRRLGLSCLELRATGLKGFVVEFKLALEVIFSRAEDLLGFF